MIQIRYIDGPRLRRSLLAATEHARGARAELNRINVFPVPDGDTGTNLALTVRAISDRLREVRDPGVSSVAREAARAAVLGARGNCGMMLSQFLLGFAEELGERERIGADELARALLAGAEMLQAALERPVEGTILTVIRDSARSAVDSVTADVVVLIEEVIHEARRSLERTPDLLPALRKAGVVDAGAKGFVSLLEGVHRYIRGQPLDGAADDDGREPEMSAVARADFPAEGSQSGFCTEALVRGADLPPAPEIRGRLRDLGDSLIVIRTGETLKVHVHTEEPDRVFEILRGMGTLVTHKAEDLREQHRAVEDAAARHVQLARRPVGVVTDTACDLPDEVLQAHGIRMVPLQLVIGDETHRDRVDLGPEELTRRLAAEDELFTTSQPSPGDFLETYQDAAQDAEELVAVLLGSGLSGTFGAGETAAGLTDTRVCVVDTQGVSVLEGLLVLKAAELAERGVELDAIRDELGRIRRQSGIYLTLDHFDRLRASGRVSRSTAWLGSLLGVKPLLVVDEDDGTVKPEGVALGRKRVLPAILRRLERAIPREVARVRFGVVHVGRPEIVPVVTDALEERWPGAEIITRHATPVVATHVGVGAWAVAYMVED